MGTVDWSQLGVGIAAILGLIYVSRTMKRVLETTLTFVGNHMSSVTAAQGNTAEAISEVADVLTLLNERVDRLHDDNIETARILKEKR